MEYFSLWFLWIQGLPLHLQHPTFSFWEIIELLAFENSTSRSWTDESAFWALNGTGRVNTCTELWQLPQKSSISEGFNTRTLWAWWHVMQAGRDRRHCFQFWNAGNSWIHQAQVYGIFHTFSGVLARNIPLSSPLSYSGGRRALNLQMDPHHDSYHMSHWIMRVSISTTLQMCWSWLIRFIFMAYYRAGDTASICLILISIKFIWDLFSGSEVMIICDGIQRNSFWGYLV